MFADHFLETKLSTESFKGQGVYCKEMDSKVPENEPGMLIAEVTLLLVKLHQETLWPNINLTFLKRKPHMLGMFGLSDGNTNPKHKSSVV